MPRQGPDGRGLPELQSTVPLRQIWYVPHVWKPDQGKADILSSNDWFLFGVRTTWVIPQAKTSSGLLTQTQIKQLKIYLRKNSWALTDATGWWLKNPARLWQILGKPLPVNILSFAKAFWDEVGLVNQSMRRQQVLKVILCFVVINSSTVVPNLVIRQVIRILWLTAGGKRRVEDGCFAGKNSHYAKDHLAAVNNSAQRPQALLLSGCGENEPLRATFKFSPGVVENPPACNWRKTLSCLLAFQAKASKKHIWKS